jgi:hypothetical protein
MQQSRRAWALIVEGISAERHRKVESLGLDPGLALLVADLPYVRCVEVTYIWIRKRKPTLSMHDQRRSLV